MSTDGEILLQIAASSAFGLVAIDRERRIKYINRALGELTGISPDAARGRLITAVFPAWSSNEDAVLDTSIAARKAQPASIAVGASRVAYDAIVAPLYAADGSVDGAYVSLRELSAAQAAEKEREASELRFRTMADCSPVLLWMASTDGLCTFFNQPWLAFTGRTMEMELGNGWAEGVHPADFQFAMSTYMTAFVARRAFRMEYRLRRADGAYRWLLDTGIPNHTPDGTFLGFIGSCIDITELKETRDELDRRVRDRTEELESFAYSVSHDLRAPLRAISGFGTELLDSYGDKLDEVGRHYISRMQSATVRMGALIDGMLVLSRVARENLARERVDVSETARTILDDLRERDPRRNVDAHVSPGLVTTADPRLSRAVLDNLVRNAWKFTRDRDGARIEVGRVDDSNVFFVRDDGVGFDMEHAERLFSPFHRLHSTKEFEGTGIGLATVHRIVSRHGGRVWAEANPGRGAVFYFTFEGQAA